MSPLVATRRWLQSMAWAVLAVYWAVLVYETHSPSPIGPGPIIPHLDKVLHLLSFGVLAAGLMLARALSFWGRPDAWRQAKRRLVVGHLICIAVFAFVDELTQPLTGRTCDPFDWLADMLGAIVGIRGATALANWRSRKWVGLSPRDL